MKYYRGMNPKNAWTEEAPTPSYIGTGRTEEEFRFLPEANLYHIQIMRPEFLY